MAVGINAAMIFLFVSQSVRSLLKYATTTASIAPNWMAIVNVFKKSVSDKCKTREAISRCAVEDTGKNSVNPSMMPKIRRNARSTALFILQESCVPLKFAYYEII